MRVTQKTIAKRLGVSASLVSRVLNGQAEAIGASPETAERIRREAAALGYTPSAIARQLRGKGPPVIGLVAADLDDPFFGPAAAEAVRQCHRAGYALTLAGLERRQPDPSDVAALLQYPLRGLLILGGGSNAWTKPFVARKITVVRIGAGEGSPALPEVRVDDGKGFELVIDHLASKGHRAFAFVGADNAVHRARGMRVRALLRERGLRLPPSNLLFPSPDVLEAGLRGGEKIARGPSDLWPTAIICSSDAVALGVLRGLTEAGWRVPEHVSVTGFDDLALARLANPPLTSVRQPLPEMVADALNLLEQGAIKRVRHMHSPSLVVRASTDFPWRNM